MVSPSARETLKAHILAERAGDLDGAMATLSDNPVFVVPNFRVEGREAVRAMYKLSIGALPPEYYDEILRALDDPRVSRWGEEHIVLEYTDDYPLHRGLVVVVHFDGDRVKSENSYCSSASRFERVRYPDDFAMMPGITLLDGA